MYVPTLHCTGTKRWLPKEVIVQINASSDSASSDIESSDSGSTDDGSTESVPSDNVPNIKYKTSGDIQVSNVGLYIQNTIIFFFAQ